MPDVYTLIRAARYLGVPPWELWEMPYDWVEWALLCQNAENEAHNELVKRANENAGA